MLGTFFVILAAVVLVGGLAARRRIRRGTGGGDPVVGDETLRRILEEGDGPPLAPEDEEPLDEDRIRDAEDAFWGEEWDEPDAWRG